MLFRIFKLCILALILAGFGIACQSTKPKLATTNENGRAYFVEDRQFENGK